MNLFDVTCREGSSFRCLQRFGEDSALTGMGETGGLKQEIFATERAIDLTFRSGDRR